MSFLTIPKGDLELTSFEVDLIRELYRLNLDSHNLEIVNVLTDSGLCLTTVRIIFRHDGKQYYLSKPISHDIYAATQFRKDSAVYREKLFGGLKFVGYDNDLAEKFVSKTYWRIIEGIIFEIEKIIDGTKEITMT